MACLATTTHRLIEAGVLRAARAARRGHSVLPQHGSRHAVCQRSQALLQVGHQCRAVSTSMMQGTSNHVPRLRGEGQCTPVPPVRYNALAC